MKKLCPGIDDRRQWMIETIRNEARLTVRYTGRSELSERVLEAMEEIPRHRFVPRYMRMAAYDNAVLPVGQGQTISQPFIVALMTDLLELTGSEKVLEIGTGTGYQTAVLSHLAAQVYSIEYLPALLEATALRLAEQGCDNVHLRQGNGWPDAAPFDGIIVTAAPRRMRIFSAFFGQYGKVFHTAGFKQMIADHATRERAI